jgi:predicted nucleic acid-binding protein
VNVALDTNVLVYAEGVNGPEKQASAEHLLTAVSLANGVIPVQVLGELFNVLVRKGGWVAADAVRAVQGWRSSFRRVETTDLLLMTAMDLAADHRLFIWDALILAAAAEARCDLLLSEDFQDGFAWRGVTVVNPFAEKPHKMLTKLLRG